MSIIPVAPEAQAERTRISDIRMMVKTAKLGDEIVDDMIQRGISRDEAGIEILRILAQRDAALPPFRNAFVPGGADETLQNPEFKVRSMSEALAARCGVPIKNEAAREFTGTRMLDMGRELLELRGVHAKRMGVHELMTRALATSDFQLLLLGTGNRVLRNAYEAAESSIKKIARQTTVADFRAKHNLMLSEAPSLDLVPEGGEVTTGSMTESDQSYALVTYAKIISLSRQAIVNDDLGAFDSLVRRFGVAAAEREAVVLTALITANGTMSDGVALFHANHGNLAGAGAVISDTTRSQARLAMRSQKGLDGKTPINTQPKFLLVPAALETAAQKYLASIYAATAATVNPFAGSTLELLVDPRFDAASATAWYVAADPALVDGIQYAYLEGAEGPQIEQRLGFEVEGLDVKCRLDFGAGILDHRGLYKNPGA